jgi:hypothetical protein
VEEDEDAMLKGAGGRRTVLRLAGGAFDRLRDLGFEGDFE